MAGKLTLTVTAAMAFAAGSWLGLGSPGRDAMDGELDRARERASAWIATRQEERSRDAREASTTSVVPPALPLEPLSPEIGSLLPDPVPWPRLNPQVDAQAAWLLAEGPAKSPQQGRRLVTFTFDDGPFPETTPEVLRLLREHRVHASFFLIGRYLDGDEGRDRACRALARRILAEGHLVGNHSHDHLLLTMIPRSEALEQIDDGARSIERATGKRPVLFRPPYGQLDPFLQDELAQRGAELVLWNIEVSDMTTHDASQMALKLEEQIEYAGGGIVLLHDVKRSTATALERVLAWLERHRYDPREPDRVGYDIVDLPTYLRETAHRPQPFRNRSELERARGDAWIAAHGGRQQRGRIPSEESAARLAHRGS